MNPWLRAKVTSGLDTGSTLTVAFDESAPLDSSHTLFAVVQFAGTASDIASNSWGASLLEGSGSSGSALFLGAYEIRGNSSVNDFTLNFTSARSQIAIALLAIPGHVTLALDGSPSVNGLGTNATSLSVGPTPATTAAKTVAIAAWALSSGGGTWADATDGFVALPSQARLRVAAKASTTAGTAYSTSMSWSSSRVPRAAIWVIQGTAPSTTTPPADTTAPQIAFATPPAGATVSGDVVLTATATDNTAVTGVSFYVGSQLVGTASQTSASVWASPTVSSRLIADGDYVIRAVARDAAGNTAETTRSISVRNTVQVETPPSLTVGDAKIESLLVGGTPIRSLLLGTRLVWGVALPAEGGTVDPPVDETEAPHSVGVFGPNGQHWAPNGTPALNDAFDLTVEADPTWTAIRAAIVSANSTHPAGRVRVLVRPGVMPQGNGAGSASTGVLQDIGSATRPYPILIVPRDGYGTVTVAGSGGGFAFVGVHGVSIMGIEFGDNGVMLRNTVRTTIGYTTVRAPLMTSNGGTGLKDSYFVEMIAGPEQRSAEGDRGAIRVSNGYTAERNGLVGCYLAPSYKPSGSSAHTDTWQVSSNGMTANKGFQAIDSVFWQSSSQAWIVSETPHATGIVVEKCLFIGGLSRMSLRYPLKTGDADVKAANTLWGGGRFKRMSDSIIAGSTNAANEFDLVERTRILASTSAPVASGAFTVDSTLGPLTTAQINEWTPYPDAAWRRNVWTPALAR